MSVRCFFAVGDRKARTSTKAIGFTKQVGDARRLVHPYCRQWTRRATCIVNILRLTESVVSKILFGMGIAYCRWA